VFLSGHRFKIDIFLSDFMDVVQEQLSSNDYVPEEDPKLYVSKKTGRGPLSETWVEDYWKECQV